MKVQAAGRTDVGQNRDSNEDTFLVDDENGLYMVCDGMGGHSAGEIASALALDTIHRTVRFRPWFREMVAEGKAEIEEAMGLLDRALKAANREVLDLARERPQYRGMGCTATTLLVAGSQAALASVGDSRFYRSRAGTTKQMTMDHTVGEEMLRTGKATPELIAGIRYARLLSRAIGTQDNLTPDLFPIDLEIGDRFVICSDGLSDYLENEASLQATLKDGESPDVIADHLIEFANRSGGADNITVVVGEIVA